MNLEKYQIIKGPGMFHYEFLSEGPKGKIRKVVRFTPLAEYEENYYNLFFGDWLENESRISDTSVSNNDDREKILATVASIVIHFTFQTPEAIIFAGGSTPPRTRLYQIGIAVHWAKISEHFDLHNFRGSIWERFQINRNYQAFLLRKK